MFFTKYILYTGALWCVIQCQRTLCAGLINVWRASVVSLPHKTFSLVSWHVRRSANSCAMSALYVFVAYWHISEESENVLLYATFLHFHRPGSSGLANMSKIIKSTCLELCQDEGGLVEARSVGDFVDELWTWGHLHLNKLECWRTPNKLMMFQPNSASCFSTGISSKCVDHLRGSSWGTFSSQELSFPEKYYDLKAIEGKDFCCCFGLNK